MATSPRIWNWIARRYARQPVPDAAAYQRKLDQTRALLAPDMTLLEFGCGTGTTALHHAPHVARIDAIDFAEGMIAIAREKAAAAGAGNLRFEVATIEDWPAPDASYDMVLGMSILHLLAERRAVLARVHALLKPGGRFLSSTVCISDMGRLPRLLAPVLRGLGLIPVASLAGETLLAEITAAGFEIEDHWRPGPGKPMFVVARRG
ncbi:class I SAM-dependent methyltransferase [Frigidibacter sp. ROC022]|uniref:class I SAM-dependent methyltransferase n=1 Tax=Frigidibacter sp. ROC022 TaxID=2971796 RepID=UPI00215A9AD1|nr:class I SAM-dependent methyltransferase [Frigidibacter sp. ROC022]MCR8725123.1 class I SAM-dependent methyltransferase [Frigidibacter sp. ROC022]